MEEETEVLSDHKVIPETGLTRAEIMQKSTRDWDENTRRPPVSYASLIAVALRDLGGYGTLQQGADSIEKFWLKFWLEKSLEFWLEISSIEKNFKNG